MPVLAVVNHYLRYLLTHPEGLFESRLGKEEGKSFVENHVLLLILARDLQFMVIKFGLKWRELGNWSFLVRSDAISLFTSRLRKTCKVGEWI